ncbi:hypothetical protein SAMN05216464_10590 [Mucilaginibacter pineti]|uniref:CarboxypepD_reg-like domain-containing protein n=1 Tax=Mucilaginibacter pineti TaxID=1391627 RepID=A0A1G7BPA7_9SPHI|nr:hypothetical protein [Mucilaginibacter pineti]SDE28306.1 hypothetical protein SAMN05216464_10590 [Mucilaginibacter pineti]
MLKLVFSLLLSCTIVTIACAQTTQSGTVYENKTRVALQNIMVENPANHKQVLTDNKGKFSIESKAGEVLIFTNALYKPDTLLLTDNRALEVFLMPVQNMLGEVKVVSTADVHKGSFLAPEYHNQTVAYHRDANGNLDGGLSLRLKYFKKDEKRKAKQAAFLKNQDQLDEIATVFNPTNIAKYLPLKGKDMDDFLILYTPSPKVYYDNGFNLEAYLNEKHKEFKTIPADKRNTKLKE